MISVKCVVAISFVSIQILSMAPSFAGDQNDQTAYEVPVDDQPELLPYAHFKMDASVKFKGDHWEFCYKLPEELTGDSADIPHIEFKTTEQIDAQTYRVRGEHSSGKCTFGENASCHLFYDDLSMKVDMTKDFLAKKYSGKELEMRSMVAERFTRDPEGILLFHIP